jgi:hypothetical protein
MTRPLQEPAGGANGKERVVSNLFLIPKPWYGPVLAPVLISGYFMVACCLLLAHENAPTKRRLSLPGLALQGPGFLLWYWSFVKDSDLIQAHGYEGISYSWPLFAAGLVSAGFGLRLAMRMASAPVLLPATALKE